MIALLQNTSQEAGKAYNVGFEIGCFIGENLYLILAVALICLALILVYFFRKNKKRNPVS